MAAPAARCTAEGRISEKHRAPARDHRGSVLPDRSSRATAVRRGNDKIIMPMTRAPGIDLDQAGLSGHLRHGSKGQAYCGFPDGEEGGGEIVVTGLAGLTGALGAAGAL